MALKATKPCAQEKRLKLFMYGDAGVGKTTAACIMPAPYIIDAENGTDHYSELINTGGGVVLHTTDIDEVIDEVRQLRIVEHKYKTLVVDPITPLYFDLVEKCEKSVGSEWGRHYSEANKYMRRLVNLLMALDMNVIITAHSKVVYGDDMKKMGITFDGWKRLDYIFDLVLELRKQTPTKRYAKVVKTRLSNFPDGETFEFTFDSLAERCDMAELSRVAEAVEVAGDEQIEQIGKFADLILDGDDFIEKCLKKAGVDCLDDLSAEHATKMIASMATKVGALGVLSK